MANPDLGMCECPICGRDAAVRESGKGKAKAYVLCAHCNFQGFSRGPVSDLAIRGRIRAVEGVAPSLQCVPAANETAPELRRTIHTADGETTIFDHFGKIFQ